MSAEREPHSGRRPYQRPSLRTIDLVAEEVMAVGCKLPSGSGPTMGSCAAPQCFQPGS